MCISNNQYKVSINPIEKYFIEDLPDILQCNYLFINIFYCKL